MKQKHFNLIIVVFMIVIIAYIFKNPRSSHIADTPNNYVTQEEYAALKSLVLQDTVLAIDLESRVVLSAQEISKSVVSVNVLKRQTVRRVPYSIFDQFFGYYPRYRDVKSVGTGVIITNDGYIITNAHVVEQAIDITVVLNDGSHQEAKIIGVAEEHDVAVLKLNGQDYYGAKIGDSDILQIGRWAIALGNPYSFIIKDSKPTLSLGVISALNRNFSDPSTGDNKIYKRMIQTDAAINPGNSGGPLVNVQGEVIGINTFILSDSGGSVGVGFAIPINRVRKVVYELVQFGKIRAIDFGFQLIANASPLGNENSLVVHRIIKDSPCEQAGLKIGDILTTINDVPIIDRSDINLAIIDIFVGDDVKLRVIRNKEELELSYIIKEAK
ncbi:MAG: trypsin-like peptidase domain-containing protein [Candidatus Cloacimonadales bacterium]